MKKRFLVLSLSSVHYCLLSIPLPFITSYEELIDGFVDFINKYVVNVNYLLVLG